MPGIRLDPWVFVWWAVLLLYFPIQWVLGAAAAACVHECFHILSLNLMGEKPRSVTISIFGARIETGSLSRKQELLCALAGPAGSFSSLLLARIFPEMAVCGIIQGAFNLLPLYPLDGGRALRCILYLLAPGFAPKILRFTEGAVLVFILVLAVKSGGGGGIILLFLLVQIFCGKRPCKQRKIRVQ